MRGALSRHLLRIVLRSTWSYLAYLLRHRIWSADEARWESAVRITLLAAMAAAAAVFGWLGLLLAYWLVPLVTAQVWLGMLAELLEHYPLIESAPRVDIFMSWNRQAGAPERFLLGEKEGEGYHLVHHLFPSVPLWRLAEVDRILARDPVYASLDRLGGSLQAIMSILAALPARAARERPGADQQDGRMTVALLHQLFEAQASQTPDAPAIIAGAAAISYAETNRRAINGACLIAHGVRPETTVGLYRRARRRC